MPQFSNRSLEKLIEQIKRHEGYRSKPYNDTLGKLTVGYGRALYENPLTKEEAEYLLQNDVEKSINLASNLTPAWHNLNAVRRAVLVNMVFQLGAGGVKRFRRMIAALENGDYETAADEMLDSRWYKQTPNRALELSKLMRSGEDA